MPILSGFVTSWFDFVRNAGHRLPGVPGAALAEAEPGVMPRVLELFAKRGLVPRRWVSDVSGPGGRDLSIDVQIAGIDPETHAYMARCLRRIWGVHRVLTSEKAGT